MPEGVTVFKPFSLPQSPIGASPLIRGGHDKRLFCTLRADDLSVCPLSLFVTYLRLLSPFCAYSFSSVSSA